MVRLLFAALSIAALIASQASAQVVQTGSVFHDGTWQSPTPTTIYNQACNGGAGGIVGQFGTVAPYLTTVCGPAPASGSGSGSSSSTPIYISPGYNPGTATLTSVSVPANTSTLLIAANTTRRSLAIIPALANTSCLVDISGNAASANSMPIPGGFHWAQLDPVPKSAVYAYCTTAATISVTEIN
jgi:hypothetical protein